MADIRVGVIMGSTSDEDTMRKGAAVLEELGLGYEMIVSSAHRNPERTATWASEAAGRGLKVIIARCWLSCGSTRSGGGAYDLAGHRSPHCLGCAQWSRFALLHRADAAGYPGGDRRH